MILVFGGTTEGKLVMELLNKLQQPFLYATKTRIEVTPGACGQYLHGAMDADQIKTCLKQYSIKLVIDAAHPFAKELHTNAFVACRRFGLPIIRFERPPIDRVDHPLVHYADSYDNTITRLESLNNPTLLALSGVQSIPLLSGYWGKYPTWFRILDRPESKAIAKKHNFPEERCIHSYPLETVEEESQLIRKLKAGAVLTKESGNSGRQSVKIEAAIQEQVHILILTRPPLPDYDYVVSSEQQLDDTLFKMTTA